MAVVVVGEDGQTFISPPELDAFTYYRDYILVRTYREFFGLNPISSERGWVDYSGPNYWYADDDNTHWEGSVLYFTDDTDIDIDAIKIDWPGSIPLIAWTRYILPVRIRFTIKDKNGLEVSRFLYAIWFDADNEFMESKRIGNQADGFIFEWDPTVEPRGPINRFEFGNTFKEGDTIEKIEFNFEPLTPINYINYWISISQATKVLVYIHATHRPDGTQVFLLSDFSGNHYHAIWNGNSWDIYYLPIYNVFSSGRTNAISADNFGEVHYFYRASIGLTRTSWNINSSWHTIETLVDPNERWDPDYGNPTAIDPNGYTHYCYIARTPSPEYRYYIGHYYQDASGWHQEEIWDMGSGTFDPIPGANAGSWLDIDSYGRIHFFINKFYRWPTSSSYSPFIMYITNAREGSYEQFDLRPWGLIETFRCYYCQLWIDRENNNHMVAAMAVRDIGLWVAEKTWESDTWTYYALGANHGNCVQGIKIDSKIHFLRDSSDIEQIDMHVMNYTQFDLVTHQVTKTNLYAYQWQAYESGSIDLRNSVMYAKNGKPHFAYAGNQQPGFIEMAIDE